MNKKYILYFSKINMENSNLKLLKKKFNVVKIYSLGNVIKLNKKIRDKITIIYCDPSNFYSKIFLNKFSNLETLASSTTSKGFIDEKYCKQRNIKINLKNLKFQNLFSELGIFILER